ncbi:MAG TPA: hypothetical protein PKO06_14325, partial [Candidatus Ozemobacteraceae bacterium]|nr:hypothetical protein [Candidatus Ozemobacteraceae bacterium]
MTIARKFSLGFLCAALLPLLVMGLSGLTIVGDFRDRLHQNRQQAVVDAQKRVLNDAEDKALLIRQFLQSYQKDIDTLRRLHESYLQEAHGCESSYSRMYQDKPTAGLPACGYVHPEFQSFGNWDNRLYAGSVWITKPIVRRITTDQTFRDEIGRQVQATIHMIPNLQAFE